MLKMHNKKVEHAKRFADFIFKRDEKKKRERKTIELITCQEWKFAKKIKKETDTNELQVRANNRKTFSQKKVFIQSTVSIKKKH